MPLPITALFAGVLALWLMWLQAKVVGARRAHGVSLGDGGNRDVERAIRAHGNAAETVPVFLILMALGEGLGTPGWVIAALGAVFVAGRVLHGLHFIRGERALGLRVTGMVLTLTATGILAIGLIAHGLGRVLGA